MNIKIIDASITWILKSFFNSMYFFILEDRKLFKTLSLKRFL